MGLRGGDEDPLELDDSFAAALRAPETTPAMVLSLIAEVLGAHHSFLRIDVPGGDVEWLSASSDDGGDPPEAARHLAETLAMLASGEDHSVLVPRVSREAAVEQFADVAESALAIRLTLGTETLATVALCGKIPTAISPSRRFDKTDLRLAFALAPQGSLLLDHARLHRSLYAALRRAVGTLASAMNARDAYTSGHSERVAFYTRFLVDAMGMPGWAVEAAELGALLHDIGKIAMDEDVLRGANRLTDAEWHAVQQHPVTGQGIFEEMKELSALLPALRHHHERYDGGGYPDGLKGEEIPLLARIVGVADSFDAMTFKRPYKPAPLTFDEARQELLDNAGTQFDPALVRTFVDHATPDLLDRAKAAARLTTSDPVARSRTEDIPTAVGVPESSDQPA